MKMTARTGARTASSSCAPAALYATAKAAKLFPPGQVGHPARQDWLIGLMANVASTTMLVATL